MIKKIKNPYSGEFWMAEFGPIVDNRFSGYHPCLIVNRFGNTVLVIPVTENKLNLHHSEISIPAGEGNLIKNSKLKVGQMQTLDIRNLCKKIGEASPDRRLVIADLINRIIVEPVKGSRNIA